MMKTKAPAQAEPTGQREAVPAASAWPGRPEAKLQRRPRHVTGESLQAVQRDASIDRMGNRPSVLPPSGEDIDDSPQPTGPFGCIDNRPRLVAPHQPMMPFRATPERGSVQRTLEFTETQEKFTDVLGFLMKYGMDNKYTAGINELSAVLSKQAEDKDTVYTYTNIGDFFAKNGYVPKEEEQDEKEDKVKSFKVKAVQGALGKMEIDKGVVLSGEKSKLQSSHALYEIQLNKRNFMLKQEAPGKSEFQGMEKLAKQGIEVPNAASLTLEDQSGEWLLMDYVEALGSGLGAMSSSSKEEIAQPAFSLGKMHVGDIHMGNVDRLPWRGNNNTGHLNNVFVNLISGDVIGLDSEMNLDMGGQEKKDIQDEILEIAKDVGAYAKKMYLIISTKMDKNKLILEEGAADAFVDNFALGLKEGLAQYGDTN